MTPADNTGIGQPLARSSATDKRLFISYSHRDINLVGSVVSLLRATKGSPVFQDLDNIVPGTIWRAELERGVEEAEAVVVFWCRHAKASEEVRKEWVAGISARKQLLPLLLDSTPLPDELAKYQWIDFREYGARAHRRFWQHPVAVGIATLGFVGAVSLSVLLTLQSGPPVLSMPPRPTAEPGFSRDVERLREKLSEELEAAMPAEAPKAAAPKAAPEVLPRPPQVNYAAYLTVGVVLVGVAGFVLARRWRKRGKDRLFDKRAKWPVRATHQKMAKAIMAELSERPRPR